MESRTYVFAILMILFSMTYDACGYTGTGIVDEEIRIILIGKTGAGKSATGNTILGEKKFESKTGGLSVTDKSSFRLTRRFDRKIIIVDTPGLADTKLSENEVKAEIIKAFTITSPGPHAFLLIFRPERQTPEVENILSKYIEFFGKDFINHLIIVFTDKAKFEEDEMTIEEYLNTMKSGDILKTLIDDAGNRYMQIGYSKNFLKPARIAEVKQIIKCVEKIKNERGFLDTPFTGKAEEIYDQIVKTKTYIRQERLRKTTDTTPIFERLRDYAREEFLQFYLGVSVEAIVRSFEGSYADYTYKLLNTIYSMTESHQST